MSRDLRDPRAPTVYTTVAALESCAGASLPRYAIPLDIGELFAWEPGADDTEDGYMVLGASGGTIGRWHRVRRPDHGADLVDGAQALTVGGGRWRTLPAATLTGSATVTLDDEGAEDGDWLAITRLDTTANTVAVVNGGTGGGTLVTLPVSARSYVLSYFRSGAWRHRMSGLLL